VVRKGVLTRPAVSGSGRPKRADSALWGAKRSATALICSFLLAGCALQPPRVWERDLLARPAMSMDADPLERRLLMHIYTSRENSSGGDGVGGGGCGCN
jgi:hypothetical protein